MPKLKGPAQGVHWWVHCSRRGKGKYTMLLKAMAWNWTTVTSTFFPLATLNHMTKPKIMG